MNCELCDRLFPTKKFEMHLKTEHSISIVNYNNKYNINLEDKETKKQNNKVKNEVHPPPDDPDNIIKNLEDTNYEMMNNEKYIKYVINTMEEAINNNENLSSTVIEIISDTITIVHCDPKYRENHNIYVPVLNNEYQFKMNDIWHKTDNLEVISAHMLEINGKILMKLMDYKRKRRCNVKLIDKIIEELIKGVSGLMQ